MVKCVVCGKDINFECICYNKNEKQLNLKLNGKEMIILITAIHIFLNSKYLGFLKLREWDKQAKGLKDKMIKIFNQN